MSRECVICHGARYGFTVGTDEEGERVLVHASPCASILSHRRQAAAQLRNSKQQKTAAMTMWTARWEQDRYGPQHELPCNCPKHREEVTPSGKDITWDRALANNPDLEYQ